MNKRKAVIAIINYQGKILLGKKRSDSRKFMSGKWHLLGENVEDNESDEGALVRGIMEEVGIKVKIGNFLGSYRTPTGKNANFYECFALYNQIKIGGDLEDAKWVNKEEVLGMCMDLVNLWPKKVKDYFMI